MRDFKLKISVLLAAIVACGDSGGATTASDSSSTSTASTDATTSGPSTGTTATTDDATDGSATSNGTSGTTGTTDDTTGDPSTTTTDDTTTTTTDTTSTTGTTGTTTTLGDTTGDTDGTSPLVIAIVDAELWADCMPIVEPDPVQGSWYVEFDNTNNPADTAAVVTGAWLSLAGGDPKSEPIAVAPVDSGPLKAGDYVSLEVKKLPGMSHGACGHCGEFYDLVLEYDEGGIAHHVEEAVTISCAF